MNQPEKPWKNPSAALGLHTSDMIPVKAMRTLLLKIASGTVETTNTARFQKAARKK